MHHYVGFSQIGSHICILEHKLKVEYAYVRCQNCFYVNLSNYKINYKFPEIFTYIMFVFQFHSIRNVTRMISCQTPHYYTNHLSLNTVIYYY